MTQVFDETGEVSPVTVLSTPAGKITQVKTKATDGYSAVQIGFGAKSEKNLTKALKGHLKDQGNFSHIKEFRVSEDEAAKFKVGDAVSSSVFKEGDTVVVSAVSKGKGFQGVVKRHKFKGGSRTHGQKHSEREPGAIGGGARAGGRVAKGMRMAGRMGSDRITVPNLKIVQISEAEGFILIRGAVPGRRGTLIEVRSKN